MSDVPIQYMLRWKPYLNLVYLVYVASDVTPRFTEDRVLTVEPCYPGVVLNPEWFDGAEDVVLSFLPNISGGLFGNKEIEVDLI